MTRTIALAVLFALLLTPAHVAADGIKVLIIGEGFEKVPKASEKLKKLDRLEGSLKLDNISYDGNIEVWRGENGLFLINEVPLEDYVEGVVKAETGSDWDAEALKAQAVIVRTYVLYKKLKNSQRQFHVTSSVMHQIYRGQNSDLAVASAVDETNGQVLVFKGKPIVAYYHSSSTGMTELPEEVYGEGYPYLKSVKSSGMLSPYSMWTRRIPISEIKSATGVRDLQEVRIKSRTATGRAGDIALLSPGKGANPGGLENTTVRAKDLRRMLGWRRLPSTDFDLRMDGEVAVFEGKGYGHGVGLCQWTALEMALDGKDYREILSYFYPGAELRINGNPGL
jgi:stage II sporulation protein D